MHGKRIFSYRPELQDVFSVAWVSQPHGGGEGSDVDRELNRGGSSREPALVCRAQFGEILFGPTQLIKDLTCSLQLV